jgi:outer membrane protein assembly factor BamB
MGLFGAFGASFDQVLVGSWNFDGTGVFRSLRAADGTPLATFDNGGGATAIGVISGGAAVDYAKSRVFFASRRGGSPNTLWSLDVGAASLTLHWAIALGDIDGSPIVRNGRVYVSSNDGNVWAVDAETGALAWSAPFTTGDGPAKGFLFPERANGDLYFATDTKVWGITDQGASAAALWPAVTLPGAAGSRPSIVLKVPGQPWLYVGGGNGGLHQLDLSVSPPVVSTVVLGDGDAIVGAPSLDVGFTPRLIYVGSEGGVVYAVEVPF